MVNHIKSKEGIIFPKKIIRTNKPSAWTNNQKRALIYALTSVNIVLEAFGALFSKQRKLFSSDQLCVDSVETFNIM
jgi:hypothetical protein